MKYFKNGSTSAITASMKIVDQVERSKQKVQCPPASLESVDRGLYATNQPGGSNMDAPVFLGIWCSS
jgi:hypothetical protein